jgi:hypothetical protein
MSFWQKQMPVGMCLRSNWGASHIADPRQELTLDVYCRKNGNHISKPIPLDRFIDYGRWYQSRAVPDLDQRNVRCVEIDEGRFKLVMADLLLGLWSSPAFLLPWPRTPASTTTFGSLKANA